MQKLSLHGKWTAACPQRDIEIPARVPGDVYLELLEPTGLRDAHATKLFLKRLPTVKHRFGDPLLPENPRHRNPRLRLPQSKGLLLLGKSLLLHA
jgi:hypothetical protein